MKKICFITLPSGGWGKRLEPQRRESSRAKNARSGNKYLFAVVYTLQENVILSAGISSTDNSSTDILWPFNLHTFWLQIFCIHALLANDNFSKDNSFTEILYIDISVYKHSYHWSTDLHCCIQTFCLQTFCLQTFCIHTFYLLTTHLQIFSIMTFCI